METISKLKYVKPVSDVNLIYLSSNNIVLKKRNGNSTDNLNILDVNKTSARLIESIYKNYKSEDIVSDVINDLNLDPSYYEKLPSFIDILVKNNYLKIEDKINDSDRKSIYKLQSDKYNLLTSVMVEITDKCNLMCKHCYMCASNKNTNMITYEDFKDISKSLLDEGVLMIQLTGGEIFENPELFDILKFSFENYAMVGLLTNASKDIDDRIFKLLVDNKDKLLVSVSIDSTNPELHDEFGSMKGAFEKSTNNIKKLSKAGISVRMTSCIFEENKWEVDKLAQLTKDLGAKLFSFNFVESFGRGDSFNKKNQIQSDWDHVKYIEKVMDDYSDVIKKIEINEYNRNRGNCGAGSSSFTIDSKKNIRPCVLSPTTFKIGEFNYSLDLKNNLIKQLTNLKEPNINNGCAKDCKFYYKCRSCYLRALNTNKKENMECSWLKANNATNLLEYI